VGDRVATAEASCFANRLTAPARRVVLLPDSISFEVAASTQSVYNTAHHALVTIARIKKGDTVLVHAAAGGVGHAAISVCQHVGAVVYATASASKRDAVRALGVEHVYDSRSTSWFTVRVMKCVCVCVYRVESRCWASLLFFL
jgi:NADPH:quinone reductase-like Zn-dependent oxidoreductase